MEYKNTGVACPRCGGRIPNEPFAGKYPGALSRVDNKTEICSKCGDEEALLDYDGRLATDKSGWWENSTPAWVDDPSEGRFGFAKLHLRG